MSALRVSLLGKFQVEAQGSLAAGFDARKIQELFSYLLLYRDRSHPREALAGMLWGAQPTARSKKYLRQALWQLQAALEATQAKNAVPMLLVDVDWIRLNHNADLWLDVATLEDAYVQVRGVAGRALDGNQAADLYRAIDLYRGNLLDGWYHDWCLFERERFENIWLASLEKLMSYCEAHEAYELGLDLGERVLRQDRARERTHRRMMRLYYLAGNRTAALRQYEACADALSEELGVKPATQTRALLEQIKLDHLGQAVEGATLTGGTPSTETLTHVLERLRTFQGVLADMQKEVTADIALVESVIDGEGRKS